MWELDYNESWAPINWCFLTVVLENTLESPLDIKEIQPVHPKGNQSWIFIGRTDAEAETSILWPPDVKNCVIWKYPDAGKDWRHEEKGMTEDEMVGWHHWLDGHEFEQAPGVGDGQGSLLCCSPWGHRVRYNWGTKVNWVLFFLFSSFFVFNTKLGLWQGFSKRNWQETCMYKWGHSLSAGCWGQCLCPSVNSKYVKVNLTYTFLPPPTHCPYLLSFPSLNNTELQIIQNIWLSHKQKWQHKVNSLGGVE